MSTRLQDIQLYVDEQVRQILSTLCIELGPDDRVLSISGDPNNFGLSNLSPGATLPDVLNQCWQHRGEADASGVVQLPFINLESGHVAHLHLVERPEINCLLLFDASNEHRITQDLQQKANEVRILMARQTEILKALEQTRDELDVQRREAERASASKSEFIASMSHEFRTPISSIMGYAELLGRDHPKDHYPQAIRRASWHLLILVENLLDQARVDQGKITLQPQEINLERLLKDLEDLFAIQAKTRALEFNVEAPADILVMLDELKLRQILINLLSNAVRYTEQGEVRLVADYRDQCLYIRISDTGPGISEADQQRIFLPFERLSARQTGAGLGLAITQRLIDIMGGELTLDSEPGKGSEFTVSIPCEKLAASQEQDVILSGHVLVIDDDENMLELLRIILEDWSLQVSTAASGKEAMEQIPGGQFDVIITDFHLPDTTGGELLRQINSEHRKVPVILSSGSHTPGDLESELSDHYYGFLPKPVSGELLANLLHSALARNKQQQ